MTACQDASQRLFEQGPAPSVALHGARLAFADHVVFEALHMNLAAGKTSCLLGPSGVGKSSLLRVLAGLTDQASRLAVVCSDGMALDGRTAYMDQRDLLYPWLCALDNVLLGARLRGEARDTERARALLGAVGLEGRETAAPQALSGGMRQRVALARTLMEDRPVVLMDEPFCSLDALTRHRLQGLATRLLHERTVLLVTHDPSEALRVGHAVHVMTGSPASIDEAMRPPGDPPRDPTHTSLLPMHRELMRRLGFAANGQTDAG